VRLDAISREGPTGVHSSLSPARSDATGINIYRATPQDVAANDAFLNQRGKLQMPILCYGEPLGRARGMDAIESLRCVAEDLRGGVAEDCGHGFRTCVPTGCKQLLAFFAEAND
jgi:hypothetical protein